MYSDFVYYTKGIEFRYYLGVCKEAENSILYKLAGSDGEVEVLKDDNGKQNRKSGYILRNIRSYL